MRCRCAAETHHPSGRRMRIEFDFDGSPGEGFCLFQSRLRKPGLWYGVGVTCWEICGGTAVTRVFEEDGCETEEKIDAAPVVCS